MNIVSVIIITKLKTVQIIVVYINKVHIKINYLVFQAIPIFRRKSAQCTAETSR